MLAVIFLVIGLAFGVMVWNGFASSELMGRGWGFNTRIYSRYVEPFRYWVALGSYFVIVIWMALFAFMAAFGQAFLP